MPNERPEQVRHHQTNKADGPRDRNPGTDNKRRSYDDEGSQPPDVNTHGVRNVVAKRERIELAPARQKDAHAKAPERQQKEHLSK